MKPILLAGSMIVSLALIFYSIAFFSFHRKKSLTNRILGFQTTALILDITATVLMIAGSSKGMFTFHGLLGYSSLSLMIIDTTFFWKYRKAETVAPWLNTYSKIAYGWWILAYITGSLLVMIR